MKALKIFIAIFSFLLCQAAWAKEPRHQGWNLHGALGWHPFYFDNNDDDNLNPPTGWLGGGVNLGGAYRGSGRWEGRFDLDIAYGQVGKMNRSTIKSPDTFIEAVVEPLFHFRKNPPRWDPYLIITGLGWTHLVRNSTSGIVFEFPGIGLQCHFNDRLSGYVEGKIRASFMGIAGNQSGVAMGFWLPVGIAYRF